jgi:predicted nucleic acid-binding protein
MVSEIAAALDSLPPRFELTGVIFAISKAKARGSRETCSLGSSPIVSIAWASCTRSEEKRHQKVEPVLDRVRRDGDEVGVRHAVQDEFLRRALRRENRARVREREIEENQEMPPRGGRNGDRFARRHPLLREVDPVHRHDRLLLPVVVDLEVFRLEAADRVAVAVGDADRNFDEDGLGGLVDGAGILRGQGKSERRQNRNRRCSDPVHGDSGLRLA